MQRKAVIGAARQLNQAAGMIATSVLIDSAMEHYRGSFQNRAMWTPIAVATMSVGVSVHGVADRRDAAHGVRDGSYAVAALAGVVGTGFHLYNVTREVGGFSWQNLFYRAPLGAPAALTLSGIVGFLAERLRDTPVGRPEVVFGRPAGQVIALGTAVSLLGTTAEVGLLHFRGAFHNPAMLLPVTMPPIGAVLLATAAAIDAPTVRRVAGAWMVATAVMGVAGVGFHAYGVSRNMGGFRNWRQTLFAGPPLPAPPSFTGLALAGLAALALLGGRRDA